MTRQFTLACSIKWVDPLALMVYNGPEGVRTQDRNIEIGCVCWHLVCFLCPAQHKDIE